METLIFFLQRAIAQGIPLLFGASGEILIEKSGNLNLGIPGIMVIGGVSGMYGAAVYENSVANPNGVVGVLIALLCSLLASSVLGLIYSFLTVTLRAQQNVTGLVITIFGSGLGNFIGGSIPTLLGVSTVKLTATTEVFHAQLPFVKSLGVLGTIFFEHGFLLYVGIIISIISSYVINKTRVGLNLRAVGENPATADAAGISVTRYKYVSTILGSIIAGFGGLYFVMEYQSGVWDTQSFGDRGWLAIALVIFVVWKPNFAIIGAFLFGGLYIADIFVPGLSEASRELFKMLPYVVTIVILIFTSFTKKKENQGPASLGNAYYREER